MIGLRRRFGLDASEADKRTRIVVAEVNGNVLGFVVDQVSEVLRIASDTVEPPPRLGNVDRKYVQGIGKIQDRLLIVIDPSLLFDDGECAAFAAAASA